MQQLPLQLQPKEGCTFDSFFPDANSLVIEVLRNMLEADGERQLFLYGAHGLGKSHLLQALCHYAGHQQLSVAYMPLKELADYGVEIFEGVEQLDLVALDDIQVLVGDTDWEQALFNLINQCRSVNTRLVLSSNQSPGELAIHLPDLVSRLTWGPVFALNELNEQQKINALQFRAQQRGIELTNNVVNYLMQHYPRDLFVLFDYLETLDQASLAQQRRITVPFLKSVLQQSL